MCGIAGFIHSERAIAQGELEPVARRMADQLRHRGPDDAGVWVDAAQGVALSHRRLAIIDLSPQGHQPMLSADGRFVIVFNGEIYNFQQLRERLGKLGHRFRGTSDTEVMLAAFSEWGVEPALDQFNGMFAFAVWDRREETMWLARDRLGEKPLYYGSVGRHFVFASELKALRVFPDFRADIDPEAVHLFFRFNYICAPYSIYRGINKLLPGSVLRWRRGESGKEPRRYWSLAEVAAKARGKSGTGPLDAVVSGLDNLLTDAVKLRMVADVPLGAFLSGGVDSSLMAALMQRQNSAPVRTFSIGFHDERLDEAPHARRVANAVGTDHTEFYVTEGELLDAVPNMPLIYDEPFADASQIPTYLVSKLARNFVTVSLSGDGPDELFGGYARHVAARRFDLALRKWLNGFASSCGTLVSGALRAGRNSVGRTFPVWWNRVVNEERARKLGWLLAKEPSPSLWWGMASLAEVPESLLACPQTPTRLLGLLEQERIAQDKLSRLMLSDALFYLPDDILVKVDRASMAVSLEARAPFLDHRVVEFAWQLPPDLKVRANQGKWLLRQLLHRYVPRELVDRPKAGFTVPIGRWMRGRLREWVEDSLTESGLGRDGLLRAENICRIWQEVLNGNDNGAWQVWGILMFQGWLKAQSRRD